MVAKQDCYVGVDPLVVYIVYQLIKHGVGRLQLQPLETRWNFLVGQVRQRHEHLNTLVDAVIIAVCHSQTKLLNLRNIKLT